MAKSIQQINKEADVKNDESSPAVVTYRLGQLESVVKDGFKEHNEKLDKLAEGFVTLAQLASTNARVTILENSKSKTWVFNTLSAVAGAFLLFLIQYALTH